MRSPLLAVPSLALALVLVGARDSNDPSVLPYLLERLDEPIFMPKGDDSAGVVFRVPASIVSARLRPLEAEGLEGLGLEGLEAVDVAALEGPLPDLGPALQLRRDEPFSLFVPKHRRAARRLVDLFMGQPRVKELLSLAAFCRERVNPSLFAYATSLALLHRSDARPSASPAVALFPHRFVDGAALEQLRVEAALLGPGQRRPVALAPPPQEPDASADPERRLAYWREDVGVNACHWHWHLRFPFEGPRRLVERDRRGELFYYFHQQVQARYNAERLSLGLGRVRALSDVRAPLAEGYFPAGLRAWPAWGAWAARPPGLRLGDVRRPDLGLRFDLLDLERWRERLFLAVHSRQAMRPDGTHAPLDIDTLGNLVESSALSLNRDVYGDLHNLGHLALALAHDPEGLHGDLPMGVMGDSATAMRDPIFYRWHAFVQGIFAEHKATLPRYSPAQLRFPGVEVAGVEVQTQGASRSNELRTFWQQSDVDVARGLGFAARGGPLLLRITHLQHAPYQLRIHLRVAQGVAAREATVRVFLAPAQDERRLPLPLSEQAALFMELDKFRVRLSAGASHVLRWSNESAVAVARAATFGGGAGGGCGCGWPQHLLLPRGSPAPGLPATLFLMLSDYQLDRVDEEEDDDAEQGSEGGCIAGHSLCGVSGRRRYPDRRPMGFPFDRPPPLPPSAPLAAFLAPNMAAAALRIVHDPRTAPPRPDPRSAATPTEL